ncbi:DUF5709 domain-containing protein [Kutzneria sp. 744]|uniref:DUF5709 domain-containing protein n=1 Tax=Kutzneria sp. (strain 744) TaxID=345341 RepID=UPI0003EED5B4|nr:DUF5709 domain-containing protein [Kutzneria sp. 744]EWM19299.1 mucin-2 [Kutzneria sp. 744]
MDRDEFDDDAFEQLDASDTLDGGPGDPLDEGFSPAEKPWVLDDWGTTPREQHDGQSLDDRLAREVPEFGAGDSDDDDGLGDLSGSDGELRDYDEVGDARAGRLVSESYVASDAASVGGGEWDADLLGVDVGIDGAGASAEEAAVHIIRDED